VQAMGLRRPVRFLLYRTRFPGHNIAVKRPPP
jgi:hypothetical protein